MLTNKHLLTITIILLVTPQVLAYVELSLTKSNSPTIRGPDRVLYLNPNYVQLGNILNLQYNVALQIGPQGQSFTCQVDTGSAWLWVTSSRTGDAFTNNHYNCSASPTCNQTSQVVPIEYGSGSVNGSVAYETIGMGGNGYTAKNQAFLLINSSSNFTGFFADGLFGLGFNAMTNGIPTFMDNLKSQGIIQNESFSLYLSNNPNGNDTNSVLILGGTDLKYTTASSLVYLKVIDDFYWAVGIISATLGNYNAQLSVGGALLDSGTSLLVVPTSDFMSLLSGFKAVDRTCVISDGFIECACGSNPYSVKNYPDLTITLGSKSGIQGTFKIPPIQYMAWESGYCYPLVQALGGLDVWILGDVFMSYYFTHFNEDTLTIGFGPMNPYPNVAKAVKPNTLEGSVLATFAYSISLIAIVALNL